MGKNNVNKRFTVSLDIDTKDVEKQVKATVGNLKTILADLGKASDKMGYFKELVNYIGQVDTALATLRNKNKNAFDHMFDGLDEGLKRQLQELFGTSGEQLGKLDVLREKLATLTPKSSIKELRSFAKEINDLFTDIGAQSPFEDIDNQFSGRANADHIKLLTDALDNFATVWNGVNDKIKGGFGLGGAGGKSSGITDELSEEVRAEIDKLNKQIQELEVVREKFKELSGTITSVKKGKAISDSYKIDLTAESIQKLMDEFDALKVQMDSSDKSSIDYYNNLLKISEVSLTLKRALSDVRADNSAMQMLQGIPSGGALGSVYSKLYNYGMVQAENILDKAFNVNKDKAIVTLLDTILNKIETIKAEAAKNTSQTNSDGMVNVEAIKKQIDELENQASRLKEIALLFEDIKYEKIAFDDDGTLSEDFAIEKTVESIQQLIADYRTAAKAKAEFEAAGDTSSADYYNNLANMSKTVLQLQEVYENMDDTLEQSLSEKKIGRGNLLDSLEKVAGETEGFFDNIFVSVSDTINKLIDESTVKLQSLRENLKKIESQPKTDGTTGKSGSGSGGSGNGQPITDIDFTSLENTIKSEISSLANKLDNVFKVEVVKNDTTDIQNAINGIKSTIEQISTSIDKYKASKIADQNQAVVDAMKNNLTQLYKYVSDINARKVNGKYQDQEIGAAILSDGSISTAYGEDGTVPWDRLASSLVANLTKSLLVDVHSHPWAQFQNGRQRANDFFSGSNGDLGAFRRSKELGAQMSAMITGNIMRTLDLSKLTGAQMNQFRTALADIEKTYANTPGYSKYMVYENGEMKYRGQSTLSEQHKVTEAFESLMYKAFERIGYSKDKVDQELFKKYNLTDDKQLTELAERLVQLSQSSQNALSPVERLAEIISGFGGDIYSEKAKVGFEAFQKGELSAAAVFNGINGKGYKISQNTLDSLYTIDSTKEISAVESLLTQITSVLDVISSSVSNIDGNTRKSTSEKFDATINDIVDISNGKISEHITQGIKSIFDPLNISDYKNQEVLAQSDAAVTAFKKSLDDLFVNAASGDLDTNELDNVLNKFTLAMSNVQDAIKQIELYEARTGDEVSYNGKIASGHLDDKYSELTQFDDLQKLLYLLSQAKIDVNKTKDFYKDGFNTGKSQVATDNNAIASNLQAIQSTLDSIYGVLQGFTGIEADSKKSLSYKKPVVDTDVRTKEFSEIDLSTLDSILQAIQEIGNYLSVNKPNDVAGKVDQDNDGISDLANFIKSKFSQQLALEDTLQAVKAVVDNLYTVLSKENNEIKIDDQNTEKPQNSDAYQLLLNKLPQNVASEDTLLAIKSAIEQIVEATKAKDNAAGNKDSDIQESLGTLVSALTANINALKDAANGIIDYQKAKKTDTTKAMARIQDPEQRQIVSGIAKNSVEDLGTEAEIESLQALANGLVRVEGAFKNANGQWEGFIVKVNEHNKAVDLAIKKHSTFANMLNNPKKANGDDNPYQYSKEEVETRAQKHLDELRAQGKNATVQFKDSGRYTITILEEIDGLSKQIFQTFDENDKKIERTTVTMSNSQKEKLDRLQRQLIDNGVTNGLISDQDQVYNDYQKASDALDNMTSTYSQMDSLSDEQIEKWKQQIVLVQQLGGQVEALVKQRGKDNEAKIFKSDRTKKLSKFDLDKAELQKNIAIPDSFNSRMDDARSAIENATDADALKIAINNWEALKNEIKATATQQDLYIKKTKETKKTVPKQDTFTGRLAAQKTDFAQYKQEVENATGVTDELKGKLVELENQLNSVGDADGLAKWMQSFKNVANEIESSRKKIVAEIIGKANSKFREVDFKDNSNNLTSEQQVIVDKREELLQQINEYNSKVKHGQNAEISGIEATRDALYQLIDAYKAKYNIENAGGSATKKAYGTAQLQNFTGKYNDLIKRAGNIELNSDFEAVQKLTVAYQHLKDVQAKFKVGEDTKSGIGAQKAEEFKQAQIECNRYAQELAKIIAAEEQLRTNSNSSGGKSAPVAEDFDDSMRGRAQALDDFVRVAYGASASIGKFNDDMTELSFVVKNGDGTITNMTASLNAARTAIYATAGGTEKATTSFGRFFDELKGKARGITTYLISMTGFQEVWQQVRQGVQYVREIDSALTELKKVTNETDATYSRFLQTMSKTASSVGSTVKDLTNSAADWSRVGYSLEDAGQLAATTAKLLNVSEFASVDEATSALVSALQAFSEDGKAAGIRAEEIVDILNNIGNRYPVATNELAEGLAASGAALVAANNSIEEQVALLSAGNATMQDISTVASGLKIVAARLRGTTTEADDDAESAITNVSKLQEKIKALTAEANGGKGIDIINESGGYKSTYEILSEVSKIFDKMDDISRASLLELIAGKNRSSVVAAILQNGKILDEAYSDALNSAGSSAKELDTYLNSIQGKIDKFNNALQTFWMNFIDSSVIKGIVDAGTTLVQLLDTVHGKILAVVAVWATVRKFKDGVGFKKQFDGVANVVKDVYNAIKTTITATQSLTAATLEQTIASRTGNEVLARRIIIDAGLSASTGKLTKEQIKNTVATLNAARADGSLTTAQYLAAMSSMGLKTAIQGLWVVLKANPVYAIAALFVGLGLAIDQFATTAQKAADAAKEAFDEIQNVVNSTESTIQSLESELSTLQEKIDALDGKKLSFAEDQELDKLKKQREELEHSLKVQEQLLELQKKSSNDQAIASMKAYTKAASQGAKETQKTANTIGTIIGGLVSVAGIAASVLVPGDFGTIGAGAVAVGSKIASAGGLMAIGGGAYAGSKAGEWVGSKIAENDGTYDAWYETYTKALDTARAEEQKALEKYQKDSSNIDKLDKWQEAKKKVSDIETEMYDHMSKIQQYVNSLEYGVSDEIDSELNTWYNFLDKLSIDKEVSGAEVTALDRIFGENADKEIQTIRDQILEAIESGEDFDFEAAINSSEKLKGILAYVGLEAEDVKNYFTQIGEVAKNAVSNDIISVDTYSKLSEDTNNYNEILAQTAEIVSDHTKVTQEYKDSLSELGISEEDLADCFDENNGLIVKNAKELNKLVKTSSKNVANNVKLAKSQARLQYYKLVKQLTSTLNGTKKLDSATRESISTTLSQIDVVEQAIYKYQLLEDSLLGVTNAFDEFNKAKEIDALNTYGDSYVEMAQTMYDALYKTGQVGTEQFQAALKALVPDNIYQGLAEEADRMQAIFDYFNNSIAPTLTLEDDSLTLDSSSIENFVNKAIEAKVLLGDVKNFDLADGMNLEKAAKLMGMTTTQAYAFFAELDKYNTGSEQSFLSQLDDSLEGKIVNITSKLEELNKQKLALLEDDGYETNKDKIADIDNQIIKLQGDLDQTGQNAYNMWQSWTKNEAALAGLNEIKDKVKQLDKEGAAEFGIELKNKDFITVTDAINLLLSEKLKLEEPTVLTAQLAIDNIDAQIATLKNKLTQAENDPTVLGVKANADQTTIDAAKQKIQDQIQALEDDQVIISTEFGIELSEEDKKTLQEELDSIEKFTINDKEFTVIAKGTSETMKSLQKINDYSKDVTKTVTTVHKNVYSNSGNSNTHSGSGGNFVNGTAHANGSLGAPRTETALTGELGPELLVRGNRWFTVGENGAEFTQVKKGDIVFNHKQTEQLLKNGYVTGRGKAYANGTSYGSNSLLDRMEWITKSNELEQLAKYAEEMCEQYEKLTNGNVDLRKRPHLSPSYEHELAMSGGYYSFIGSDGKIYASTSAETMTIGEGKNQYTIDITPVLENGEALTSDSLAEYVNNLVTDGSMQDLLDSDKYNLIIRAVPGEYDEKDWSGFESKLSEYKDGYLNTILDMFDLGGEKAVEAYGFSSVGLADVSRDLQNNGSYAGKEVASAIDDTSEGMRDLNELINQYVTDVLNAKSLADEIGTDLSKAQYGNVDTDTRQKLYWNESSIDKYSDALDSWGIKAEEIIGTYSTLLSAYSNFDGVDIAFSPILQTEDGPQLLDSNTVHEYIWGLIDKVSKDGRKWTSEELFQLDTEGLEFNGTVIKNLLEDIGESASTTSQLLHYVGDTGAISNLEGEIETTASELIITGENISDVQAKLDLLNATNISDKTFTVTEVYQTVGSGRSEGVHIPGSGGRYTKYANGTVHVNGSAYNKGSFGAPKTETALVGELGPELLVRNGRWTTVGEDGAEFAQVKKGDIIFNHKQTEDLLSKGYVTGRGKALASGTAYAGLWQPANGSGSGKGSSSSSSADDAKDQFEELFDWIEVRLEEINEDLSFKNARLENSVGYSKQNAVVNEMLDLNEKLYDNLIAGANKYYEYAGTLLAKIPAQYRKAAQDGSIAIETFIGEVDEETYNAIQDFREWVQKGDDAVQQAEEVITDVSSLAKQAVDNIATDFGNKNSLRDSKIDQLDAYNALAETKYGAESETIYQAIIKETNKNIKTLETQRDKMQAELDKQVKKGNIQKYSQDWYDAVNAIAEVDTEIINLTKDTYDYQDSINELHWDAFDIIISRLEAVSDEADNLIDILGEKDLVNKDTAKWTKEGITSLGLYAQKMEVAEMQAKKYKDEINYLNKNWKKLGYTEQEYVEKLEELKEGQYDAIKAYNDTKKAIVDLNKERVEAIKDGIQKEIDAYEELINKKKEELDADKDAHDWQKTVADKQKNIADIERKIAALSADNSASARAQRAKLEAELLEAQADLEEAYYDRSITDQQNALDKELENFKENKDKEIEGWDQYLENTEQVVADSLSTVQTNTDVVYNTLKSMGKEYSLSIAESLTSPWKDGETAIQSFSEKFGLSMSSTVEELQRLAAEYKKVMDQIANAGNEAIKQVNENASRYQEAANPNKPKFQAPEKVVKPVTAKKKSSSSSKSTKSSKSSNAGAISGLSGWLQYGNTGSNVKTLQQALNNLGFNAGTVDGIFGYNTKQAVIRFQSSSKYGGAISADGIVGPDTKKKFKAAGYSKGTSGVKKNQLALIDELGEELQLVPDGNGRLAYLKKGTAIIPHDISENLMQLGQLNPQDILDRNRPTISAPHITNNETVINIEYGDVLHIENFNGDKPEDLSKMIDKAFDKHMKQLNSEIRRYTR